MTAIRSKNLLFAAVSLLVLFAFRASAQQISYYTFDTPGQNPSQYSWSCNTSSSAPLFCLDYTGSVQDPSFIQDPSITDPNGLSGGQWVVQMTTPASGQSASMWFSVPQNVANGFNAWFQFKITPSSSSGNTADGLAFVIQNSLGGGTDSTSGCSETGSGSTVVGSGGGCLGYGGIDNSVALEFDTYYNSWDPNDYNNGGNNDNHVALQSCGLSEGYPLPNSPVHLGTGNCLITLGSDPGTSTLVSNPQTSTATPASVTLADKNLHQVVVVYNGPLDIPANTLTVYLDPAFNTGTLTPVTGSVPLFSGPFTLTNYINLNSDSGQGPAYVGFTAGTGAAFEQHEVTGFTFTPHTQVSQTQPVNPPGTPTTFSFGTHNYTVNYPRNTTIPAATTMTVIATPIPQLTFDSLINATPFAGSMCQVYDDTGNNCIAYNVSCTNSGTPVACPSPQPPPTDCATNPSAADCVNLTTGYNNSIQPGSPGFLQGDPFYSPIDQITPADPAAGTATVQCSGECAVTPGQTVNIVQNSAYSGSVQVLTSTPNSFTFSSSSAATGSGGFLTSINVQNIFTGYSNGSVDGSTTGKTTSFSDFIATGVTAVGSQTQLTATTNTPMEGVADLLTATITAQSAQVPGPGNMPTGTIPAIAPSTVVFSTGPSSSLTPIAGCSSVLVTPTSTTTGTATCSYTPGATGPVTITAQYSDPYHVPSSSTLNLNVAPPYDTAIHLTFGSTTLTYPGTTTADVCITPATTATATGTVKLNNGSALLSTQTLGSNGCVKWTLAPGLAAGTHTMTVAYSGDRNNPSGNSAPVILTVNPAPVLMVPLCGPAPLPWGASYGCLVGFIYNLGLAQGVMTYSLDGGTPVTVPLGTLGVAQFTIAKPALGTHHVVLNYAQQTNFAAAGPLTETFTVTVAPVTVTLTPSTKSTTSGKVVSFIAAVTSSSAGAPSTGAVSFYDGATLLTSVPVNASGVASYSTTTLPVGSNTIKATYGGSTDYGTGSASVTVTIAK